MQKILLIEDNEALRENTAEILSLASFQVETAENGKVGIEMALKNPPDLIVCDIMMPVLDGYGVYQIINKNEALQHIPFIFLSAKSERSDLRKGMEMGADDYITKPFTDAELINAIKTRLEKVKNLQNRAINNMETWTQIVSELGHKDEMHERLEHHDIIEYKKKQVIYSEGQHPNKLFYIESGKIKIYKSSDSGKELITNLLSPGEFFGYASLIENKVYEEFAETLEESSIRIIPRKEFEELISNNHEIALKRKNRTYYFSMYEADEPNTTIQHFVYHNQYDGEYLLPELKHMDFIWWIRGDWVEDEKVKEISQTIRDIKGVQLVVELTPEHIKNKGNLIFE